MRFLACTKPGTFNYIGELMPVNTPGYSIFQVKRIGICGTDLHAFEKTQPYFE